VAAGQAASAFRAGSTDLVEPSEPGSLAAPKRTLADYATPREDDAPPEPTTTTPEPTTTTPKPATAEPEHATATPEHATPAPEPATAEPEHATTEPEPATTGTDDVTPDAESEPSFPLPPAPPGEPGYAPSDVARLMKLLTTAPDREQLLDLTLSLTTTGGYHTGTVDALRQAWIDALPTKQP
jgi:hypothetical protein